MNITEQILELFQEIGKPTVDGKFGEKEEAITAWLDKENIKHEYIPGIGLIVNKQKNPKNIVVSHMDLIKPFQKRFEKNEVFVLDKPYIQGALDNTITNAVALLALKNSDMKTELVLTEGEESGLIGMTNYLEKFKDKAISCMFINLDVTNEGFGYACSVEYDRPVFEILKSIQISLSEIQSFYTHRRFCDDTDAINAAGANGFSYCLPTEGVIHSFKNRALLNSIEPYFLGLESLMKELSLPEERTTIDPWKLEDYLSVEMISEKEKLPPIYHDLTAFIAEKSHRNIKALNMIEMFLTKSFLNKHLFTKEDLDKITLSEEETNDLLETLIDEGIVEKIENNFKFN